MGKIPTESTRKLCDKIFKFSNDLAKFKTNCNLLTNPMLIQFANLANLNVGKSGTGEESPTNGSNVGGESSTSNQFNASEELERDHIKIASKIRSRVI